MRTDEHSIHTELMSNIDYCLSDAPVVIVGLKSCLMGLELCLIEMYLPESIVAVLERSSCMFLRSYEFYLFFQKPLNV